MNRNLPLTLSALCLLLLGAHGFGEEEAVALPAGVKAVWDVDKADRAKSPTRERVCLNGLWRWQPAKDAKAGENVTVPVTQWGYIKVPAAWGDPSQIMVANPAWGGANLKGTGAAWYQREFTIPQDWKGRRIAISADYVNSLAVVYVDGKELTVDGKNAGIINFPGGEVDITSLCGSGGKHVLSALVFALPMEGVNVSFNDSAAPKALSAPSPLQHRGFCGDLYLIGTPVGARVGDVKISTSVRKGEITAEAEVQNVKADARYAFRVRILDGDKKVKEFTGKPFSGSEVKDGRMAITEKWKADKLWDINTPQNMYHLELTLLDAGGKELDVSLPVRFGYREIWIDGRDFYLNGTRIFFAGTSLESTVRSAADLTYEGAKETLERMKSVGINFAFTIHFGCNPGAHLGLEDLLRAADDVGFCLSFSMPHEGHYAAQWSQPEEADAKSDYARHSAFYVRMAENHPSVVCYSMNHNAGGIGDDMKPDEIDGKPVENMGKWGATPLKMIRAENIVRQLDPTRVIYHHAGGNVGQVHTSNFYPNFTPIQELSEWFGHWATEGMKPVYANEYGAPYVWDWTMYRGYYKGTRTFGSASVPWEFSIAEWNSQWFGDRAYQISENEKANLRFEGKKKAGDTWRRWDYPVFPGCNKLDEVNQVMAMYFTENQRANRTWGLSINSIYQSNPFWKPRDGVDRSAKPKKVDWDNIQRPGYSVDNSEAQRPNYDCFFYDYERSDWIPSAAVEAVKRNNMPLLAYIAGKAPTFTSKEHNYIAGEPVEKQLIVINNSRMTVSCDCSWSLNLPQALSGKKTVSVNTGDQERIPVRFDLPKGLPPGSYTVTASVKFSKGEAQTDTFVIQVLAPPQATKTSGKIALFDPKGETAALLKGAGIACQNVDAAADLSAYDTLIVGKAAFTVDGPGPDVMRVRDGLKVVMFEQTADVLEKRFGFRVAEYGLRTTFPRVPDHPLLAGLTVENLRDWRGVATIMPEKATLKPAVTFKGGLPSFTWCGTEVTKIWRVTCRGNVASVLIEKPACGNFLPIVDGGFSLQYSPLMEYHEGKGLVIFCQMDVTGRTESEVAAAALMRNILQYATAWKPSPGRKVLYAGEAAGKSHLEKSGLSVEAFAGAALTADQVLVVGPGGGAALTPHAAAVATWLKAGGNLLALGLDEAEANTFMPVKVGMTKAEHIASFFDPPALASGLAGVGSSDIHSHTPRELALLSAGATIIGDGVLAKAGNVVFSQMVPWQFPYTVPQFSKRTFRHTSFLVSRLLGNMGVSGATPVLERFKSPAAATDTRWLTGLYLDQPEEWDYPYRFFRW